MKRVIRIIATHTFLLLSAPLFAQDTIAMKNKGHVLALEIQSSQFKDQFNYGLVFYGANLSVMYSYTNIFNEKMLRYETVFGFGPSFNKGAGIALKMKPVDIFYGQKISPALAWVGGYFSANYLWQFYPDIHSGHMFWYTTHEAGIQSIMRISVKSKTIEIAISNSLLGLSFRPKPSTETYYYTLNFPELIGKSHQNLKFGSFNRFNHTSLEVGFVNKTRKRSSVTYVFEYLGYFQSPKLSIINHSINLKLKIGKH